MKVQTRRTSRPRLIEALESRRLLSASWSTVDSLPSQYGVAGMAADKQGNVYGVGDVLDANGDEWIIRMKAANSSGWTTLYNFGTSINSLTGVAADAKGNLFVIGQASNTPAWTLWSLPHGGGSAVIIDTASGVANADAVDSAGNVYVAGYLHVSQKGNTTFNAWSVRKGTFNGATGTWSFSTIDQVSSASIAYAIGVATTTVNGSAASAVYTVGRTGSPWVWTVRRSVNGGPWSQVDSFRYDLTSNAPSVPWAVGGDPAGNIFVAGYGEKGTITGYSGSGKNKTPIYSYSTDWIVRKSTDGGASWAIDDDIHYSADNGPEAWGICSNPVTGKMYVAGQFYDHATQTTHAIVRANVNADGSWKEVDNYTGTSPYGTQYNAGAIAADTAGNVYAGGYNLDNGQWIIRSQPAAATNLTAAPDAGSPASQIDLSWTNAAGSDETGFAIYRSSDGGATFTLVATVSAGVTAYSDGGLAAGTTYTYYVVTLLNSDGASDPSNTASATTAIS